MPSKHAHYYETAPDWKALLADPSEPISIEDEEQPFTGQIDVKAQRAALEAAETVWSAEHPLGKHGYNAWNQEILVRDGATINLRIYQPSGDRDAVLNKSLPILFLTHAGGFIQGSHVAEEIFLLRTLLANFPRLLVISVNYRLAPENKFPIPPHDSWDALIWVVQQAPQRLNGDVQRLFLGGSSAGGGLAAVLASMARDRGVAIKGCLLNVPVLCDPQWFPKDKYEFGSYDECERGLLTGEEMSQIWGIHRLSRETEVALDLYLPDRALGADWKASPLLSEMKNLPPFYIFVAGADPVRDEGIAFSEALNNAGVTCKIHIYQGVPHTFSEFPQLETTKRFDGDLVRSMEELLRID